MNNLNLRRILKQPTLRMADGGSPPPSSFKGMFNSVKAAFTKTPEEQARATALAEYQARAAAERAPAPAPARDTAAPMGSQNVLNGRMKAEGQLRNGGELRMNTGGQPYVPGFETRNPGVVANQATSPSPGAVPFSNIRSLQPAAPVASPMPKPVVAPVAKPAAPVPFSNISSLQGPQQTFAQANADPVAAATPGVTPVAKTTPSPMGAPTVTAGVIKTGPTSFGDSAAAQSANPSQNPITLREGGSAAIDRGMGGHVPGTGHGDKIPAKYEPGEFVVSNAMLAASPGLREELHDLRGNVLAQKGMTPAEADAKAVSGKTLRAVNAVNLPPIIDPATGKPFIAPAAAQPIQVESPAQAAARVNAASATSASAGGPTTTGSPRAPQPNLSSGPEAPAQPTGTKTPRPEPKLNEMRAKWNPVPEAAPTAKPTSAAFKTGQAAGKVLRHSGLMKAGAGKAAGLAGISYGSSYDSYEKPIEDYRRRFDMDPNQTHDMDDTTGGRLKQAVSDAGVRGVGALQDFGAKVLDSPVDTINAGLRFFGGKGDISLPGGSFTDYLQQKDNPATTARVMSQQGPAAAPAPAGTKSGDMFMPGMDPAARGQATLRDQVAAPAPAAVDWAARKTERDALTQKDIAQGNAMEASRLAKDAAHSAGVDQMVDHGMRMQDKVDQERALQGAETSAASVIGNREQFLARNKNVESLRGQQSLRLQQEGENKRLGMTAAAKLASDTMHNKTLLRGQDMVSADGRYGHELTYAANKGKMAYEVGKDQRDYARSMTNDAHAQRIANNEADAKNQQNLHAEFATFLPPTMVDGKPVADTNGAAQMATAFNAKMAADHAALSAKAKAGDRRAAAALEDLEKNKHAAYGPEEKRQFVNGMKLKNLASQYHSGALNPVGGRDVATDEAPTSLRKTSDGILGFGGEYKDNTGRTYPARAIETEDGSFLGGKTRTDLRGMIQR